MVINCGLSRHILELVDNELVLEAGIILEYREQITLCNLLALGSSHEVFHGLLSTLATQHHHIDVLRGG